MGLPQIIATNILRLLEQKKATQNELSTHLDVSRQTLSNYLKGISTMDCVRLVQTADFFNVPVTELLTDHRVSNSPMLFRSALNYQEAIFDVEPIIGKYITCYEELADICGRSSRFVPEQHNLFIEQQGEVININYDFANLSTTETKINGTLEKEILEIADTQRKLLNINQSGAISLIPALIQRGINVIFLDFSSTDIYGLSICDDSNGCFIFVNSNEGITIERQLFTVAHEFGHIILHRPLFKQQLRSCTTPQYVSFLDKMADKFAGRLLCPPDVLFAYADQLENACNDLEAVLSVAISIKKELHVSLQSLMLALKNYKLIGSSVVNEFFRMLDATNTRKKEPYPIRRDEKLLSDFNRQKNSQVIDMLKKAYTLDKVSIDNVTFFLGCDEIAAKELLLEFERGSKISSDWLSFVE